MKILNLAELVCWLKRTTHLTLRCVCYGAVLAMFFFRSESILADETEYKYPPYPNVWGYEMPIVSSSNVKTYPIDLFKLPDGDILITYPTDRSKPIYEYAGLSFFSQHKWGKDAGDLMNRLPRASTELGDDSQAYKIVFSDGTYLIQESKHPLGCYDKTTETFVRYAKDGQTIWKKSSSIFCQSRSRKPLFRIVKRWSLFY